MHCCCPASLQNCAYSDRSAASHEASALFEKQCDTVQEKAVSLRSSSQQRQCLLISQSRRRTCIRQIKLHMSRICSRCFLSQRSLHGQVVTVPRPPFYIESPLLYVCTSAVLQRLPPRETALCGGAASTKRKRTAISHQQPAELHVSSRSDEETEATDLFKATLFWAGEELQDVGGGRFYPCRQASLVSPFDEIWTSPLFLVPRPVTSSQGFHSTGKCACRESRQKALL